MVQAGEYGSAGRTVRPSQLQVVSAAHNVGATLTNEASVYMEGLAGYVATGVVMLVVGLALRELEPKVRIIWWHAHSYLYQLSELDTPIALRSDAVMIQNTGKRRAEFVEAVWRSKPDHYSLNPSLDHETTETPSGDYVIRVKSLGPKEFFTLQILSYEQEPVLNFIRSDAGQATNVPIRFVRWLPRWVDVAIMVCFLAGAGLIVYWLIRAGMFVLQGVGVTA